MEPKREIGSDEAVMGMIKPTSDFEDHIQRCLSMVLHHEEVQQIADVIIKIKRDRTCNNKE